MCMWEMFIGMCCGCMCMCVIGEGVDVDVCK